MLVKLTELIFKFKDGIMHKAVRGRPLSPSQKRFNRLISKFRFVVEQDFGTLKRKFSLNRASYYSPSIFYSARVKGQCQLKAMCLNLLKAINKVIIPPLKYGIS